MASTISVAVDQATRLSDIQFPEFTAKLITDTFDALISANLRQTESYVQLVEAVSKDLTTYINDTKDDISGAEILEFLAQLLPLQAGDTSVTRVQTGNTLTAAETSKLTAALVVPGDPAPTVPATALQPADVTSIAVLVSRRLAANKYTLLKEMVKMGILRLVVTQGRILSQLTFSTSASSYYLNQSSAYNTSDFDLNARANSGRALSRWFNAAATTRYTTMAVRTTNETQQDVSGSSVNIFGSVEINFKTDYQPMNI